MRVTLMHNPTAGKGKVTKKDLLEACKLAGHSAIYHSTKTDDIKEALREPGDLVVVAGGDGIVSKIAREMLHRKVPLTIVPLGNANNIARSLGIAGTVQELAEGWARGHKRTLNVGVAFGAWGNRKFVEAVGFGPFARVIKNNTISERKHGAANLRQGRKELRREFKKAHAVDCRLELDRKLIAGKFVAIEVANIAYTGPGLELAPRAKPDDSVLDVIYVKASDRRRILSWLEAPHDAQLPLRSKRGRKVRFRWYDVPLRIDDDVLPPPRKPELVNLELAGTIDMTVPSKESGAHKKLATATSKAWKT
jgi:diacylglycerol kinase family enzyme